MTSIVKTPTFGNLTATLDLVGHLALNPATALDSSDFGLPQQALSRYVHARQKSLNGSLHPPLSALTRTGMEIHSDGSTAQPNNSLKLASGGNQGSRDSKTILPGPPIIAASLPDIGGLTGLNEAASRLTDRIEPEIRAIEAANNTFEEIALKTEGLTINELPACATAFVALVSCFKKLSTTLSQAEFSENLDDGSSEALAVISRNIEKFFLRLSEIPVEDFNEDFATEPFCQILLGTTKLAALEGPLDSLATAVCLWNAIYLSPISAAMDPDEVAAPSNELREATKALFNSVNTVNVNLGEGQFIDEDDGMAKLVDQCLSVIRDYLTFEYLFGDDQILDPDQVERYITCNVKNYVELALNQLAAYAYADPKVNHAPLKQSLIKLKEALIDTARQKRLFNTHQWASEILFGRVLPSLEFLGLRNCPTDVSRETWRRYLEMRRDFDRLVDRVSGIDSSEGTSEASDKNDISEMHDVTGMLRAASKATSSFKDLVENLSSEDKSAGVAALIHAIPYLMNDYVGPIDSMVARLMAWQADDKSVSPELVTAIETLHNSLIDLVNEGDDDGLTFFGEELTSWIDGVTSVLSGYLPIEDEEDAKEDAEEDANEPGKPSADDDYDA